MTELRLEQREHLENCHARPSAEFANGNTWRQLARAGIAIDGTAGTAEQYADLLGAQQVARQMFQIRRAIGMWSHSKTPQETSVGQRARNKKAANAADQFKRLGGRLSRVAGRVRLPYTIGNGRNSSICQTNPPTIPTIPAIAQP